MAFLHCHNCDWSQDDFWHEGYTPLHGDHFECVRQNLIDGLQKNPEDRYLVMDKWFAEETGVPCHEVDGEVRVWLKDFIAWELERRAQNIREMLHWTDEDFLNVRSQHCCPKCGSNKWDVD